MAKVLVVDDTAFMRLTIRQILEGLDHEVIEAKDGLNAISQFTTYNPDLVIMDITMPQMDGIEALKEIKKINAKTKVLMCSAMGQQAKVVEAIEAGASTFIVKPFQNEKFIATVNALLSK